MGRNEKLHRRSRRQGYAPSAPEREYENTGVFSGVGRPKSVGVSDVVAANTRSMAQRAKRAEREWLKSLPKGVRI